MNHSLDQPMTDAQTVRLLTATVSLMLTNIEVRMKQQMQLTPVSEMMVTLRHHIWPYRITRLWKTWSLMTSIYNIAIDSDQRDEYAADVAAVVAACRQSILRTVPLLLVELEELGDVLAQTEPA